MLTLNALNILNTQMPSSLLNTKKSQEFDVVVVGAGILGSALATALGKQGKKVCLIERDWNEPDRIVGELLQPGGINALRELGLADAIKGMDGIDVYGYSVFTKDDKVLLTYPENEKGISFHHGRFVMNLRSYALYQENVSCLEATVNDLKWKKDRIVGVDISYKNGEKGVQINAPLTIIADGCFSKFRKYFTPKVPVAKSSFVG
jgi:squalene monooxygenase